jgi:hypothetical protein
MWYLNRKEETQTSQTSFVGGRPSLPSGVDLPICALCGERQTFMFQVAFPHGSDWAERTLACFSCMRCADENFLIPEMLSSHRSGANIPAGFLTSYQRNFAFLVFPTANSKLVSNYVQEVAFHALEFSKTAGPARFGKIGGAPNWVLEDEAPGTYDASVPMVFLMELESNVQFSIVDGAPPQMELDLLGNPSPSPLGYYQLFLGNALYLFGTSDGDPLVYAITQV